jgi:hypothetical protein
MSPAVKLAVAGLALLSFFVYPGHTFLESDSQIFMPVLLHMQDPALYRNDVVLEGPHTAYTLYDELVRGLNFITGIRHELLLYGLQIVFRLLGLLGVYWLLGSLELAPGFALLGAGICGLGAWVFGPTVLTVEYEPVPRAFALPLVLLGLGLVGRGRYTAAGIAGTAAFLLHPPTVAAFWLVYLVSALARHGQAALRARWKAFAALAAGAVLLLLSAWLETGPHEPQLFLARIDPAWEKLQRLRAPYVWPTLIPKSYFWMYGCMGVMLAAAWRLATRNSAGVAPDARAAEANSEAANGAGRLGIYLWMLPLIGLLSAPVTYVLIEKLKWAFMPQFQPMRYLLYDVLFGILLSYAAAIRLLRRRARCLEGALWMLAAFVLTFQPLHIFWLAPLLLGARLHGMRPLAGRYTAPWRWSALMAGVAGAAAVLAVKPFGIVFWTTPNLRALGIAVTFMLPIMLLAWLAGRYPATPAEAEQAGVSAKSPAWVLPAAAFLAALLLLAAPLSGRRSSQGLITPELLQLSAWAREQTPADTVFLFPDAGRGLDPGVFRYYARRAVYVDWKTGGQMNYFRGFSGSWWQRWQATMAERFQPATLATCRAAGIRYLVFRKPPKWLSGAPIYRNGKYAVIAVPAS